MLSQQQALQLLQVLQLVLQPVLQQLRQLQRRQRLPRAPRQRLRLPRQQLPQKTIKVKAIKFRQKYKYGLVSVDQIAQLENTIKALYSGTLKADDFTPDGLLNLFKLLNNATGNSVPK